jgi:hypothetical protein
MHSTRTGRLVREVGNLFLLIGYLESQDGAKARGRNSMPIRYDGRPIVMGVVRRLTTA